jgi:hypothetical protein
MEDTEKTGVAPGTRLSLAWPVGGPRSCMAAVELQMFFSRLPPCGPGHGPCHHDDSDAVSGQSDGSGRVAASRPAGGA